MSRPARTVRVEHRLGLDTIAKILFGCDLPAHPRRRDIRVAVTGLLAEHGRVGALQRFDEQRRQAQATGRQHQHRLQQRLAACRQLAEHAFPASKSRPKGRPLIEALYGPDTP